MTGLIIALVAASVWAGAATVIALKGDNTDEVIEAMAANTEASLAPLTLELQNVATVLDDARLDRHCTPPEPGKVDSQYLWCLAADCWQQQGAQGQNASETCGKIRDLADALTRCELQVENAEPARAGDPRRTPRADCLEKLTPK